MAQVLLFHHVHGLTPGVLGFAERLRAAGHDVTTPDLYEGATFADRDEGLAHAQQVGFGTLLERGVRSAEALPADLVYAGFSLGVLPAQQLAQTRPGARGALLMSGCLPVEEFGGVWPEGVALEVHAKADDPLMLEGDLDAAQALVAQVAGAELVLYPGDEHLFADSSLADYDEAAAGQLTERALAFLARTG